MPKPQMPKGVEHGAKHVQDNLDALMSKPQMPKGVYRDSLGWF